MRPPNIDPARVAADLRRRIAHHDHDRRARQELIYRLQGQIVSLKLHNMVAARLVGRLRRDAQRYEADAGRASRQRRFSITTDLMEAA